VKRFASGVCPRVMLDGNRLDADAFDLSGGDQQKILFARANCERHRPIRGRARRTVYAAVCTVSDREEYFLRVITERRPERRVIFTSSFCPSPAPKKLDGQPTRDE
jgi:ABC-type sugar transport system ATPase subunit